MLLFHLSVALTIDGSVWTWGANTDGQLGWPSPACALPQDGSPAIQMRVVVGPQASCAGLVQLVPDLCLKFVLWSICGASGYEGKQPAGCLPCSVREVIAHKLWLPLLQPLRFMMAAVQSRA